jgi:2-polyprenyl-3-methyl-5-hydroxy-6-metoxy-1,4-benzoquinol methylase
MLLYLAMESQLQELNQNFSDSTITDAKNILVQKNKEIGYWSNLDQEKNEEMIKDLNTCSTKEVINKHCPNLMDIIFSNARAAGLELLNLQGNESCIDYGCMWGALTIPLSLRTKSVVAVDQTYYSLCFLHHRILEKNLTNILLVNYNIKTLPNFVVKPDIAIINGVLEWIPNAGILELSKTYGKYKKETAPKINPYKSHLSFLTNVHSNLNKKGKTYLAIENRYDINQFLLKKDPHVSVRLVCILPRFLSNIISKLVLGRPYINWLYSFKGLKSLLKKSGFSNVELYACFPHYHAPKLIIPYDNQFHKNFTLSGFNLKPSHRILSKIKCRILSLFYIVVFKYLRLKQFAPSIIAIAHK